MKTTLDLPDDLMREMKLRAVIQGRTLRDLVAEFLRQGLGLSATPAAPEQQTQTDEDLGRVSRATQQSFLRLASTPAILKVYGAKA